MVMAETRDWSHTPSHALKSLIVPTPVMNTLQFYLWFQHKTLSKIMMASQGTIHYEKGRLAVPFHLQFSSFSFFNIPPQFSGLINKPSSNSSHSCLALVSWMHCLQIFREEFQFIPVVKSCYKVRQCSMGGLGGERGSAYQHHATIHIQHLTVRPL